MDKETRELRDNRIFDLASQGVPQKMIKKMIKEEFNSTLTKGRISQIISEMQEKHTKPDAPGSLWYFEALDHAIIENSSKIYRPPVIASVGEIVREDNESIFLRQIWSKTKGEDIRFKVIVKSTIVKQFEYTLKKDED